MISSKQNGHLSLSSTLAIFINYHVKLTPATNIHFRLTLRKGLESIAAVGIILELQLEVHVILNDMSQ